MKSRQPRLLDTSPVMPSTPIRSAKDQRGTDGLPLFDPKVKHEQQMEQGQQSFGFTGTSKARR